MLLGSVPLLGKHVTKILKQSKIWSEMSIEMYDILNIINIVNLVQKNENDDNTK